MKISLYYIGDNFYSQSGTSMSSIYKISGQRYDWGFIKGALRDGHEVHIRQATQAEMLVAYKKLNEYKEKQLQRMERQLREKE